MSKVAIAKTNELTHKEWLILRKHGIGGSDAAAVCGMNRWRGPLDVYLDKTSTAVDEKDNEAMYWGRVMEPVLREEFAKRTGLTVSEVPFLFACKEYPFMFANIDGIVREKDDSVSLLEIKTANGFAAKEWENGLPQEYFIQIQHYLAVCDLKKAYVAVLIGGNNFRYEVIDRDDDVIQTIIAMEASFWTNNVQAKKAPEADATSSDALNSLYPHDNNTSIILSSEADRLITNLEEIKKVMDDLKKDQAEAENQLKAMMKEAECGKTPAGYSVRWKNSSTSRLDTTKLKAEQPEVAAKYTKTTTTRRFSISAPKEEK